MKRQTFFDRSGIALDLNDWRRLVEDDTYVRVAQDIVGPYRVSTVWLGVNHNWRGTPPIIFETCVFMDADPEFNYQMYRYPTEEEALVGHERVCARFRIFTHDIKVDANL